MKAQYLAPIVLSLVVHGAPTARMAAILGIVIFITIASAFLFQTKTMKQIYRS